MNTKDSENHRMTWANENIITEKVIKEREGFVYRITEISTMKLYYGIKKFKKRIRRKPLKGKKRVRIDYVESDWRTYKTSSPIMQKNLEEHPENYHCSIMKVCESVTEMKAYEAYMQLSEYVNGNWSSLINEVINLRIRIRK